ncbi:MAG: DNA polymerase III subunit delta' [Chloroflexota bacterium]
MWGLAGHEKATEALSRSLRAGRLAHAYLITGVARVGKSTLALRLAQALNCDSTSPPCGQCRSCRRIERGLHVDTRIIQLEADNGAAEGEEKGRARGGEKNIGIGQVRALQREVALAPQEGRWRTYVILNAENLSLDAGNSLLKVLEEPPPHVVLILTATDANMLLPTIVSRCQTVKLQPVAAPAIAEHLRERHKLDAERAQLLARLSGGRIGWAIEAAENEAALTERDEALARLVPLIEASVAERMASAGQMATEFGRERGSINLALELWLTWWRDVLLVQAGAEELVANHDRLAVLRRQAQKCPVARTHTYLRHIEAARAQLDQNVNPRLALEALLLNIPSVSADSG